jgi:hypothetical protein
MKTDPIRRSLAEGDHVGARPQEKPRERDRGQRSACAVLPEDTIRPLDGCGGRTPATERSRTMPRSLGHRLTDLTDIDGPRFSCPFEYPTILPIIRKARLPA